MALTAAAASVIGAGLSTAASIGSGFMNQAMNKKQFNRAADFNTKMYYRQLDDQKKLIADQRIYDSPQATLARLREAGLNPNLMSGAFGGASGSVTSVPSGGSMSPMGSNPMPDVGSTISGSFGRFASGIDTTMQTELKLQKGEQELEKLKADTAYQHIVNEFAEAYQRMGLAKGQQDIEESLARVKGIASQISLNDSVIELNGHKIQLVDKQADLAEQNTQLAIAKEFLTNLNAEKLRLIMPYVQAQTEAEYYLTRARGDAANMAANLSYEQANLAFVQALKEHALIKAGYADAAIAQMKADADYTVEQTKYYGKDVNTRRWQAVSQSITGAGQIALGIAGIYLGSKIPKAKSGGIYLPGNINMKTPFGSETWILK